MKIIWSPEAIDDLAALRAYISRDNPSAARRIALHLLEMVETTLAENPHIGRPGRVPGTREFVIDKTPYIVPYRVKDNALQILRIYHGARRWPESL
ncbi:type II toxin-antitoxin system RelE/ParE family toxin [Methylocystis sp.]|uniref:type II toxin-antitoxin system RelE/ParE family toxin n=1 Tax=Methylocystis sp. TaxID=1911079 RepID=UPI003DA5CD5D